MHKSTATENKTSETPARVTLSEKLQSLLYCLAIATSLFHLWVNTFGTLSEFWRNSLHLGLLGAMGFLAYPLRPKNPSRWSSIIDIGFSTLMLVVAVYFILAENFLIERNLELTIFDSVIGIVAIVLTLELARRTTGVIVPLLSVFFLSYILWWGKLIEGLFYFRGMRLNRILYRMSFSDQGLFGITTSISSTSVFMFVLFASFLLKSGGTDFIIKLSKALTGKIAGGSALVAVAASGLMGTISGSAVANTVSTGSITIPLMKRTGFKADFAAGVETAASVGGQLMPPVMGAGAFIMSQWTGLPYQTIVSVAFLPALMYFATIGFYVWLEAQKNQLEAIEETSPSIVQIIRPGIPFILPIVVLVGLLILGYTPTYAAGYSILVTIVSSWLSDRPMKLKDILDALAIGAKNMVVTGILLIAAGLIIGSIATTGMSITLSQVLIDWSGGNLLLALISIALASLVLGMGLPVTAAYIMLAVLAAPALENMGISLLAAHLIIFWLSQDSNVTPPVCLAAYAAAGIAETSPLKTAISAWKLAKGLYIMPLLFAFTALIDGSWSERLVVFVFGLLGLFILTTAITGYCFRPLNIGSRIALFGLSLLIFLLMQ
ncbi:TRAP-type transport system, permease component [Hyella patelloides LEGE 07179]|uniref:TRAP-type transport system, permease component n=1 Tax=Hyella patelloides LEGE 07179 TaxID=945734 RepID=A0A563W3Q7_9CYAN|nr:TRAP transporter fused permease subunit [Hyella patelloides]VEP18314.1 TRAP-type transport system, permease component [Hyella patelloides LEGE 07179]